MKQKGGRVTAHHPKEFALARDIIVIGASAGGVEALVAVTARLPLGLPAAVFIVLHISARTRSILPRILQRAARLPTDAAEDNQEIVPGRIYVAPPNHHLMLAKGYMRVEPGPQENGHRPAVDPLFRSAARVYGRRVIGVILTGNGDDGTAGLIEVKRRGGLAVVETPSEAFCSGMPRSALEFVDADYCLPLAEIGPLLGRLAESPGNLARTTARAMKSEELSDCSLPPILERELTLPEHAGEPGPLAGFTCPHCNGHLWEVNDDGLLRFRCRVGHALTAESLLQAKEGALEATLWAALNGLEEKAALVRRMSERAAERGHVLTAQRLTLRAEESEAHARRLRDLLTESVAEEQLPEGTAPVVNHPA